MLTCRIVPCLDVDAGRVVKGTRFRDLRDCGDPAELAARYARDGADEIVLLDVSATTADRGHALATTAAVRVVVDVPLCIGGGVRTVADARALLEHGADKVAVNSAAVRDPTLLSRLADAFGSQAVVLAIDALPQPDGGHRVRTHAGTADGELDVVAWIRAATARGIGEVLLTSIDRDGTGLGYDTDLLTAARAATDVPLIASGGARTPTHLLDAARAGADALLIASMLHDGRTSIPDLKRALAAADLPVRASLS
ncbi:MAG: imidazole glycerol phosphate synthase subunit HisF [Planctomycetes bacterium]|nr:imidazole glycerol phosphate synthase subunit HisF [Planctomycetota bacterium]